MSVVGSDVDLDQVMLQSEAGLWDSLWVNLLHWDWAYRQICGWISQDCQNVCLFQHPDHTVGWNKLFKVLFKIDIPLLRYCLRYIY